MPSTPELYNFPLWSVFPFVVMLLSIAIVPMAIPHWWDSNRNKFLVSIAATLPVLAIIVPNAPHLLLHSLLDYFSFIWLLGALFFIFVVSNVAGLLTPLGDPPLFLGFLRGVPFQWTLTLLPQWAFAVGFLL